MLFSNIEDQIKRFHATYYVYVIIYISYFHFFDYNFDKEKKRSTNLLFAPTHRAPSSFPPGGGRKQTRNLSGNRERTTDLGNSGHGETNDAKKGRTNKVGTKMTLQAWGIYFGGGGIPMDQFHRKKSLRFSPSKPVNLL